MVTGQAPVPLKLRNTPGRNTNNSRWYTHISHLTRFMPPPETYRSEIGSLRRARFMPGRTSHYSRLEKPTFPMYSDCHPRKTTTYILHVVHITTHTRHRRKSIREKRERKKKNKEDRKENRRKRNKTKKESDMRETSYGPHGKSAT